MSTDSGPINKQLNLSQDLRLKDAHRPFNITVIVIETADVQNVQIYKMFADIKFEIKTILVKGTKKRQILEETHT